ncbi:MAG: heavy metal transporter [Desulfobacteraceae bacterium 4572_88]|nr:MAG: heavy metal transporter [Desulfobacteraceae bacterium 4572_88]
MEKQVFSVPNISCGHCVTAVKNELDGVSKVDGNSGDKTITVEWDAPATLEKIRETLKEINYPAASQSQ